MPIEDVAKIGGSSAGGMGFMYFIARFLKGDIKRAEAAQAETNKKIWAKCDQLAQTLVDHRIEDAKTFISRDEFSIFRTHMDDQFEKTRGMLFEMLKGAQK